MSHLEGDALNVALLVPAPRRVLSGVLLDALTEHYSSPGRLGDYRSHFERVSRMLGDDPSVFAVELEIRNIGREGFCRCEFISASAAGL